MAQSFQSLQRKTPFGRLARLSRLDFRHSKKHRLPFTRARTTSLRAGLSGNPQALVGRWAAKPAGRSSFRFCVERKTRERVSVYECFEENVGCSMPRKGVCCYFKKIEEKKTWQLHNETSWLPNTRNERKTCQTSKIWHSLGAVFKSARWCSWSESHGAMMSSTRVGSQMYKSLTSGLDWDLAVHLSQYFCMKACGWLETMTL